MIWSIPAKTFLLGEYAALESAPAIVLTTYPSFSLALSEYANSLHPESPAGRFAAKFLPHHGLSFNDPYKNLGGLGASSAEFIGVYLVNCFLKEQVPNLNELLELYAKYAFKGKGLAPSGYDVIAQALHSCVYINKSASSLQVFDWAFKDIGFIIVHTGQKLSTHMHLETAARLDLQRVKVLTKIVEEARLALANQDSKAMIAAISRYQAELQDLDRIALHSSVLLEKLRTEFDILAAKGCGAMGADVLLLIIEAGRRDSYVKTLKSKGLIVIASDKNIFKGPGLINDNKFSLDEMICDQGI